MSTWHAAGISWTSLLPFLCLCIYRSRYPLRQALYCARWRRPLPADPRLFTAPVDVQVIVPVQDLGTRAHGAVSRRPPWRRSRNWMGNMCWKQKRYPTNKARYQLILGVIQHISTGTKFVNVAFWPNWLNEVAACPVLSASSLSASAMTPFDLLKYSGEIPTAWRKVVYVPRTFQYFTQRHPWGSYKPFDIYPNTLKTKANCGAILEFYHNVPVGHL